MFAKFALLSRLLYVGVFAVGAVIAAPPLSAPAWADDDDDDDDDDGDDDDDDDDDDDGGDDDDDDDDDDDGYEQPPFTAGGLYTKRSWPIAELERNLTLLGGMAEFRTSMGTNIENENAFETFLLEFRGLYGIKDWSQIELAAFVGLGEFVQNDFAFEVAYEHALAFNLANFRLGVDGIVPAEGDFVFETFFGFPFRYKPKPQVAIIALERLMTIQLTGTKPDFTPGLGVVFQAVPQLALLLRADFIVTDFNFDNSVQIPATAAAQFSPNNKVDLGLQFRFLDLNNEVLADPMDPESGESKPFDRRDLLLFAQLRI